jgi:hypothetical protein
LASKIALADAQAYERPSRLPSVDDRQVDIPSRRSSSRARMENQLYLSPLLVCFSIHSLLFGRVQMRVEIQQAL